MQPQLPPILRFDHSPIVVPVGEQVGGQGRDSQRAQVFLSLRLTRLQKAMGECSRLAQIDSHMVRETDVLEGDNNRFVSDLRKPGYSRPQACVGMVFRCFRP